MIFLASLHGAVSGIVECTINRVLCHAVAARPVVVNGLAHFVDFGERGSRDGVLV